MICIIGAGASGLFAACIASKSKKDIVILEKNEKAGKKIYITGKGRCNVTNAVMPQEFLQSVVTNYKFLYSSIFNFTPFDTINFFEDCGVSLKTERGNRVFPVSDKASDITKALINFCTNNNTQINYNENVIETYKNGDLFVVKTNKQTYMCEKLVISTGGKSYSATGSTGDGYKFAKRFGHTVLEPRPALCSILLKDSFVKEIAGVTFKNVTLIAKSNGKKVCSEFGELLITHNGISGPIALTMSSKINKLQNVDLYLDLKPALDETTLLNRLEREISANNNLQINTVLKTMLPTNFVQVFLNKVGIAETQKAKALSLSAKMSVVKLFKEFNLAFDKLDNIDYAIITSGGVNINEVNPKTMESKLVKNLFFTGEVLDIDALTGGFNIQIALSTAFMAGSKIGE